MQQQKRLILCIQSVLSILHIPFGNQQKFATRRQCLFKLLGASSSFFISSAQSCKYFLASDQNRATYRPSDTNGKNNRTTLLFLVLPYLQASFQSVSKHPDVQRGPVGTMLMKGETGPCQPFQWCSPSELHLKDLAGKHCKFNFRMS